MSRTDRASESRAWNLESLSIQAHRRKNPAYCHCFAGRADQTQRTDRGSTHRVVLFAGLRFMSLD